MGLLSPLHTSGATMFVLACAAQLSAGCAQGDGAATLQTSSRANDKHAEAGTAQAPLLANTVPLVTTLQATLEPPNPRTGSRFENALSADGERVLLGLSGRSAAFVFVRNAASWTQEAELNVPGPSGVGLGRAVGLSGTFAIAAAGHIDLGAVFVFHRSAAVWSLEDELQQSASNIAFGSSVAIDGVHALVGARTGGTEGQGTTFVFARSATSWGLENELQPTDGQSDDWFGTAVALRDGRAVVSTFPGPGLDPWGRVGLSSVYVFERGSGAWQQTAKLMRQDAEGGDHFGDSLALYDDTLLVGKPGPGIPRDTGLGAAYAYRNTMAGWLPEATLEVNLPGAACGTAVALLGDRALVGCPGEHYAGRAYLYQRSGANWSREAQLRTPKSAPQDGVGKSVALSSESAIITPLVHEGAYVFGAHSRGSSCSAGVQCATGHCTDGVCCDSACDEACGRCDLATSVGSCQAVTQGAPGVPACEPFLCDGIKLVCKRDCDGPSDCADSAFCTNTTCVPKGPLGTGCTTEAECASGHCVDGYCCEAECDGACARCNQPSWQGRCTALPSGDEGSPSCGATLCNGEQQACPTACIEDTQCARQHHCEDGICRVDEELGAACSADTHCSSGSCTDGLCCTSDSCDAYRCGAAGLCATSCTSGAQCALGHECSSGERCAGIETSATLPVGCHIGPRRHAPWLAHLLALLGVARLTRSRRRGRKPPGQPPRDSDKRNERAGDERARRHGKRAPLSLLLAIVWLTLPSRARATSPRLEVPAPGPVDGFAASVSVHGDRALVSGDDVRDWVRGEAAYIFAHDASGWSLEAELRLPGGGAIGSAVSLSGNTALIGEPFSDAAHVFQRSASSWALQATLSAQDGASSDHFGFSVSLDGERALVGAHKQAAGTGAVYSFVRSAGVWRQENKITPNEAQVNDWFGYAVGLDGDRLAISNYRGPTLATAFSEHQVGRSEVYVFERSATAWQQKAALSVSSASDGDRFGSALAVSGDRLLVGRPGHPEASPGVGAAFIFARNAAGWQEEATIPGHFVADRFGQWVDLVGDRAAISAGGPTNASSFLYTRKSNGWQLDSELRVDGPDVRQGPIALGQSWGVVGAPFSGGAYVFGAASRGDNCASAEACASGICVDEVCCDAACEGRCESCTLAGSEGTCTIVPDGSAGAASCGGHLCDGQRFDCPTSCSGDAGCGPSHRCATSHCIARGVLGVGCSDATHCLSGHCIEGRCCDNTCDAPCASCDVDGLEGTCSIASAGSPGAPSCAPSLCDGEEMICPQSCLDDSGCAGGHHCHESSCRPDQALGSPCDNGLSCGSGLCTHGVCCNAAECAPYRCGGSGICVSSCKSSAECAPGYQCSSGGQCVEVQKASQESSSSCSFAGPDRRFGRRSGGPTKRWAMLSLLILGLLRRRRTGCRLPCQRN